MLIIYGIKNCDTVKKARQWLVAAGVEHRFHDFRSDGLDAALISSFEKALGWEALLNTRGTTWRKLAKADKASIDADKAQKLMAAHDAIIKRPIWQKNGEFRLGFAVKEQEEIKVWAQA